MASFDVKHNQHSMMEMPVAQLDEWGLPVRTINLLESRLGIIYIGQLQQVTRGDLLAVHSLSKASVDQLVEVLRKWNRHNHNDGTSS